MAIATAELIGSRAGSPTEQTLLYSVSGASGEKDDAQVFEAVLDASPMSHNGLARQDNEVEIDPQGNGLWLAEVTYKPATMEWKDPEDSSEEMKAPEYDFDTTGGTHHIDHSIETISATPATGEYTGGAPNFHNLVGVNDGETAGVDVVIPAFTFSERHYLTTGKVTMTYLKLIRDLTGTVNAAWFRDFAPGEVLFMGARGSRNVKEPWWTVEYQFAVSKNAENLPVGDIIVPSKKGWEHLWVHSREEVDPVADHLIRKPIAAYVEKVYEESDFTQLRMSLPHPPPVDFEMVKKLLL